jgi:hypothetical protein
MSADRESLTSAPDRWHTQTIVGGGNVPPEERGDCVRACLTSMLGVPIESMENCHGEGWWDRLRTQVFLHGYDLAVFSPQYEPPMEAYWMATLPSLNLGPEPDGSPAEHCVVARGYTLIHDPSQGERYDQDGFVKAFEDGAISGGWVLVPNDPSRMRLVSS